ncbi:F-box protein At1g52495 [Capsella rubella]|uniref:F-box protein At1g52495 n=1 Tax=Capsella rubella TaxID=81985 RepID=UPI000CD4F906|nr:F-box protein At1g52495 [Capsella rubella]
MSIVNQRRKTENMQKGRLGGRQLSLDLVVEILKKLPSKSLVRFRCVSKQWSTIINSRRDFIEAIVNRSLLSHQQQQHQPPMFIFHHCVPETFFTFSSTFSESIRPALVTIYNHTTRQSLRLPVIEAPVTEFRRLYCHFGYDPVMDQYKVMSILVDFREFTQTFHVFTLGSDKSWRRIQGIDDEQLLPSVDGVCIQGTIYYGATRATKKESCGETVDFRMTFDRGETVLLSFHIRSERFYHVSAPEPMLQALSSGLLIDRALLNHQGKLVCIGCCGEEKDDDDNDLTSMWVFENTEKQEWSKITFDLPELPLFCLNGDFTGFSGFTPAGEIFVTQYRYFFDKPVYVYYYDMNRNCFRRVEIQGTRPEKITKNPATVKVFGIHDHVENTMLLS